MGKKLNLPRTDVPKRVSIVGVLPGPRNGMTLMTERIVDSIQAVADVRIANTGRYFIKSGLAWSAQKALQSIIDAIRILSWRPRPQEQLYMVLNSHGGLYYNLFQAIAARLRGFRFVLHHHVWVYVGKYDWRIGLINFICGRDSIHVVACPKMAASMLSCYGNDLRFFLLSPGIINLESKASEPSEPASPSTIGMLSNLTIEKGVEVALITYREIRKRKLNVRFRMAGPIADSRSVRLIKNAIEEFGSDFEYVGAVYGSEKAAFYGSVDVFLFPTHYRNESWGIVLNEALMAGVPVFTTRRGCTEHVVGGIGGFAFNDDEFIQRSAEKLEEWTKSSQLWQQARSDALLRGKQLKEEADRQLTDFLRVLCDEPAVAELGF